jgi:hypothetical protein
MILKAIMQVDKTAVIAPTLDDVKFNASNAVEAVSASSTFHPELLHLKFDKATATSIEVGVSRTFEVFVIWISNMS